MGQVRTPGKGTSIEPFLKEFYKDCKGNKVIPEERGSKQSRKSETKDSVKRRQAKEVSTASRNYNWGVFDKLRKAKES